MILANVLLDRFFKPVNMKYFGTFQDGALHHNNPAKIALWEQSFIWPEKTDPGPSDLLLSIGTGDAREDGERRGRDGRSTPGSSPAGRKTGPLSPIRDGWLVRCFEAFNWNLDGERSWREVINFTDGARRDRLFRLNLPLDHAEPRIDDAGTVEALRAQTLAAIPGDPVLRDLQDKMLAALFYLELTECEPRVQDYRCVGVIRCRAVLSERGRHGLLDRLSQRRAYFKINGRPVPLMVPSMGSPGAWTCAVRFCVDDLGDQVHVTLEGPLSRAYHISGSPRSAESLIALQGLQSPFGCKSHVGEGDAASAPIERKRRLTSVDPDHDPHRVDDPSGRVALGRTRRRTRLSQVGAQDGPRP